MEIYCRFCLSFDSFIKNYNLEYICYEDAVATFSYFSYFRPCHHLNTGNSPKRKRGATTFKDYYALFQIHLMN